MPAEDPDKKQEENQEKKGVEDIKEVSFEQSGIEIYEHGVGPSSVLGYDNNEVAVVGLLRNGKLFWYQAPSYKKYCYNLDTRGYPSCYVDLNSNNKWEDDAEDNHPLMGEWKNEKDLENESKLLHITDCPKEVIKELSDVI